MYKRLIAVLLLAGSIFALSACGASAPTAPTESEAGEPSETAEYHVEYSKLPGDMLMAVSQYCDGENIYLCGMNAGNKALLYRYDGKLYHPYTIPGDISYLHACCALADGLAVLAGDDPAWWMDAQKNVHENQQEQYALQLLVYNKQGQLRETIPLDEEMQNGANYLSVLFADGYFYILSEADLFQVSAAGALVGRRHLESGQFVSQLLTPEGLVLALYGSEHDDGGNEARIERLTSAAELSFETLYADPDGFVSGLGLTAEGKLLFLTDGAIQGLPEGKEDAALFFDFRENGVYSSPYVFVQPWDQALLLIGRYQTGLDRLINEPPPEAEELVLWTSGFLSIPTDLVRGFSESNPGYRLRVEHVDPENTATRAKILAGEGPDLYYTGAWSAFRPFESEDIYEDLLPYMEKSDVAGLDQLLPVVQEAVMSDGKLYLLPTEVEFITLVCKRPDLLDGEISMERAMQLPEVKDGSVRLITKECSRTVMWRWLSNLYVSSHVDRELGACSFDTLEYAELLKSCMMATANEEDTVWDDGEYIFCHDSFPGLARLLFWQIECGEHFAFSSDMGASFTLTNAFSIAKSSERKEGAWRFLEYVFGSYAPDDLRFFFPASSARLEQLLESAQTTGIWYDPKEAFIALEPYAVEQMQKLLNTPAVVMDRYPGLMQIMNEEAEKFFAGARSAEETATATQSRASIYVAEHFG